MLPALTTRPKQAVRQVQGLTDDSIDAYSNTPLGSNGAPAYADNTDSDTGISRASAPTTAKSSSLPNSPRNTKKAAGANGDSALARVVRDRKASGDDDLSLKVGDVVRVLSSKRTGYLKCEFGDVTGYVPSSYLEFFEDGVGAGDDNRDGGESETPRASEKRKKKKKKEKRRKDNGDEDGSDLGEAGESAPTPQSPQKETARQPEDGAATERGAESPRRTKKKHRKQRHEDEEVDEEAPTASRKSNKEQEEGERTRRSKRQDKKKRERYSSESSGSDQPTSRSRRGKKSHRRRRRHSQSGSGSDSDSSADSDASYRRRRRRRHRRSSSEEEDYDSDQKRRARRGRKQRQRDRDGSNGSDMEPEAGSRSARSHSKKRRDHEAAGTAGAVAPLSEKKQADKDIQEAEAGLGRLNIQDKKATSQKSDISDHVHESVESTATSSKESTAKTNNNAAGTSQSRTKDSARKDDESRAESTAGSTQKSGKTTLGKQIGDKMRSFLGGGKKNERASKNSSGILNACPGTIQGEEGWYEHGENERYYFVLLDGKWSLLYGPMTEDDFELYSNKVLTLFSCTRGVCSVVDR